MDSGEGQQRTGTCGIPGACVPPRRTSGVLACSWLPGAQVRNEWLEKVSGKLAYAGNGSIETDGKTLSPSELCSSQLISRN